MKESYLIFGESTSPSGKTKIIDVMSKGGDTLGVIKWFGQWRKYCFYPEKDTIFDKSCLDEISNHINNLMLERKYVKQQEKITPKQFKETLLNGNTANLKPTQIIPLIDDGLNDEETIAAIKYIFNE